MFYIHRSSCISPQETFQEINIDNIKEPADRRYMAIEPAYDQIPPGILRRMGKSVRMGVGAAMPLLQDNRPDGIIIGTANGGKEDCVKFLNQVKEYDEGMLTPINFVQSTPNAVAAQIGLLTKNLGYNVSHLHLGLAFEFAMIDADMMINDDPAKSFLLGGVDDISTYNYYFEEKGGWYKDRKITSTELYKTNTPGSIAGEAATMFLVSGNQTNSIASVLAIDTLHSADEVLVKEKLSSFITKHLPPGQSIDLLVSGENGDGRLDKYYSNCESLLPDAAIARFKHMCGEYPTATGMALWLACEILGSQSLPGHMIKKPGKTKTIKNLLIYNTYKGIQHSFILVGEAASCKL
ncbi:MAG: beta-ketoacyl synthase chain length factor [Ferruginibacter sp.]